MSIFRFYLTTVQKVAFCLILRFYKLFVDFGPDIGERKTSAQITEHYALEDLVGKQVAAVTNFPKKQIGKFMSEFLVLGFPDENGSVVLVEPNRMVPNGGRLF